MSDAMVGLSTGNRAGKPLLRNQEILTPPEIVAVCNKLWGRIQYDPCYHKDAITDPVCATTTDGLNSPWVEKTYINCPYKDLKAWLMYGYSQPTEQIWLVPVRTNRRWWRAWRDKLDAYVELDPVRFLNYHDVFPAPLLLGYRGDMEVAFAKAALSLGGDVYFKR